MWLLALCMLVGAPTPNNERLLLLEDSATPNLERRMVHHQLLRNLLQDPATELYSEHPLPPGLERGAALQAQAELMVEDARRYLHALQPAEAASRAAAATLRFGRLAALTGDVTRLGDALSLEAAARLLMHQDAAAQTVIERLISLDPTWRPDPALFSPEMQQTAWRIERHLERAPRERLTLHNHASDAAVFVDGHFTGFGSVTTAVYAHVPHYVWVVPAHGAPYGETIAPRRGRGTKGAWEVNLTAWPASQQALPSAYAHIVDASRLSKGEVDPHHPALAARGIDTVLVLGYRQGALTLTTFELKQGRRRATRAAAVVTDLWDVARLAETLRAPAPPLAIPPAPPRA